MSAVSGRVQGKTAIVTGAASGIGEACAKLLAREGANVVVSDVNVADGKRVAKEIGDAGGKALFVSQDVTSEDRWHEVVEQCVSAFGGLNILVCNAGVGVGGNCETFSLESWRDQFGINVDGVFLGVKHAIPKIRESDGGSIIVMSSVSGLRGTAGMSCYCATKGAIRMFTKAVAIELAQQGDNIRVNSIHPGPIDTPIWSKVDSETLQVFGGSGNEGVDVAQLAAHAVPGGGVGQPDDIAEGVLYLASDAARYVNASELVIDGGASA